MSFSFQFVAKKEHVNKIVEEFSAPFEVAAFISQAVARIPDGTSVLVRAHGHLMKEDTDYDQSTADLLVEPLLLREPFKKPE